MQSPTLEQFLSAFRLKEATAPTHTRFGDVCGSYYVPSKDADELYSVYSEQVHRRLSGRSARAVCLIERQLDVGPVVIDLDFRFHAQQRDDGRPPERRYDRSHVERLVRAYARELNEWVQLPEDGLRVVVMEKPSPRLDERTRQAKDGLHIVLPGATLPVRVKHQVRRAALASMRHVFQDLGATNHPEDVFDESVVSRNGWMMYGSSKAGEPPYEVSMVLNASVDRHGDVCLSDDRGWPVRGGGLAPRTIEDVELVVRELSVRNKPRDEPLPVRPDKRPSIERAEEAERSAMRAIRRSAAERGSGEPFSVARPAHEDDGHRAPEDEFETARRMVQLLDDDRAESYAPWIRVGLCLHNIDSRLLSDWIAFSRRSSKFQEGVCEIFWQHMRRQPDGLGMGSLRMWARQDSPQLFEAFNARTLSGRVRSAITGTHHDIAVVIHAMFSSRFACSSVKNNTWWEFRSHRWHECDSGFSLRRFISIDVFNRFAQEAAACTRSAQAYSADGSRPGADDEHQQLAERADRLMKVAKKLRLTGFKDSVMKECRELFYRPKFEDELDSRPHLIGFDNGVYDLDAHEFRDGMPEDMISFSTRIDYAPHEPGSDSYLELQEFLRQIHPDDAKRRYYMRCMASCLHGSVREERFHILTGTGSNGKSITVELFESTLGDYCCKLPISLLTQKRVASNAANSEVARIKGRRFACLQEPDDNEKLNIGLMKEMTGGDIIIARQIYREPVEFRPMIKMFMTCNNLPEVRADDGGTWRRIRVIEFTSNFTEHPEAENEFPLDLEIRRKFDGWKQHFMSMLIETFKDYISEGNPEPDCVMAVTRNYRQNMDAIQMFIDTCLELDPSYSARAEAVHARYRDFIKEYGLFSLQASRRQEIIQSVQRHTKSQVMGHGNHTVILGVRLRAEEDDVSFAREDEHDT